MRRVALLAALLATFLAASTAHAAAIPEAAQEDGLVSLLDAGMPASAALLLDAHLLLAEWGGRTTATNGEAVTVYISDAYPADPALQLRWADFMTSLVHGPELSTVTIHLGTRTDVQRSCGNQALACYSSRTRTIVAPAESFDPEITAQGALIHEYGHHVAANRTNEPFRALDYGTKRWATYHNVCARSESGDLYPGAEDGNYALNPGEAFAEAYRVLNERRLGIPEEAWQIVTESLYPDANALSLLEQDVVNPWTVNTATSLSTTLSAKVKTRTVNISVPFDGTLVVAPRKTGGGTVIVSLLERGSSVATSSFKSTAGRSVSTTACGQRKFAVRLKLGGKVTKTTKTTVSLVVSTP